MNWNRLVFKTHKWLAAGVGLLTLVWFVSGIVLVLPLGWFGAPGPVSDEGPAGPGYNEATVTVPQALRVVEMAQGAAVDVTGIGLHRRAGRLLYAISTRRHGTHLVNALSGERLVINEDVARQFVGRAAPGAALGVVALLRAHDADYRYGPLPAYRVTMGDARRTSYYVAAETGEMRATNRGGRIRGFLAGLHSFDFLRPMMNRRGVSATLILFSAIGTLMSLFGLAILWIQFATWRARKRRAGSLWPGSERR